MLENCNIMEFMKLVGCIKQTIFGDSGIAINEENDSAHSNVPKGPRAFIFLNNLSQNVSVGRRFIYVGPSIAALDFQNALFYDVHEIHAKVHIRRLVSTTSSKRLPF